MERSTRTESWPRKPSSNRSRSWKKRRDSDRRPATGSITPGVGRSSPLTRRPSFSMHGGSITCVTPYGEQVEVVENMTEEEFLGELAEKTTSVTLREFTPDGVRISYNLQGKIRGQYDADHMETVDAIFKPDGTYEFESLGMDQTVDGDMLLIKGKGTGRQLSPTSVQAEGVATFMTQSKNLGWLNSAKARFEGTYTTTTGEFIAKVFAQK